MTISYNWLCDYLPEKIEPAKLSVILTSIGLEVESLEKYESIKGALNGLIVGEVIECMKHPDADKLSLTKVNTGEKDTLQIVCGAPNVAVGQKVIVAPVGTTIYPLSGLPMTMKVAKIRGAESYGMICAEDEIGLSENHDGILVLDAAAKVGMTASEYFKIYSDWIFEIGLTPNHMDAMSHLGVARDVCAYLTHHTNKTAKIISPFTNSLKPGKAKSKIKVRIENTDACRRYAGVSISGVQIKESPQWLQDKLKAIGQRPINNIVDITNFVLHETGQPLHAFDEDEIKGNEVIIKNLAEGTVFVTLDEKERKLSKEDLMICDAENGICIAGVFGGLHSGVTANTKNIFLESAWFNPVNVRKTAVRQGLRTEASSHFEKGVDISNSVNVLKRAALMIIEIAGGEIVGDIVDVYPQPQEKNEVSLKNYYLKKLSGKNYHPDSVKKILTSLGFEIVKEGIDELRVAAPFNKPDILLPADVVEEIIRIDGLDNIEIPSAITLTPSANDMGMKEKLKEKLSGFLAGNGYNEIVTNSITNSRYYDEAQLSSVVKMMNNLSADLNILRPSMHETALECIAYNINRKNSDLKFFEFGKTYSSVKVGEYGEDEHFCVYATGHDKEDSWRGKSNNQDYFTMKGVASALLSLCNIHETEFCEPLYDKRKITYKIKARNQIIGELGEVRMSYLEKFDIKQAVYFIDLSFKQIITLAEKQKIIFEEVARFPAVQRDISFVVDKMKTYVEVEKMIKKQNISKLKEIQLFDIFESDKIGETKKSMAVKLTFLDEEKTLTDELIDAMLKKIIKGFENELGAEIRK